MFSADQTSGGARWPLVRVSVGGETQVVLLSHSFLPLTVHWVGRSVPCPGGACSLCSWLPGRGLFYTPVMCLNRLSILELAALSQSHFEQHCKLLHGGVRPGLVVRLTRRTAKAPIYSEVMDERSGVREVPVLELAARVMALYQLPGPNVGEDLVSYSARIAVIATRRSEAEAKRLVAKTEGAKGRP